MPHLVVVPFAPFHFKRHSFDAANVFNHIRQHRRLSNGGGANRYFIFVFAKQDPVKGERLTGFGRETFNFNSVAGANPVLFATRFNYRIHKFNSQKIVGNSTIQSV
jgi:hypothetical protein